MKGTSRRGLLAAGAGLAAGVVVAEGAHRLTDDDAAPSQRTAAAALTRADGTTQAGVDRPVAPPTHLSFHALAAPPAVRTSAPALAALLRRLGEQVLDLVEEAHRVDDGGERNELTVQIGLGPRLLGLSRVQGRPDVALPAFRGSAALDADQRGGDLFLLIAAARPETAADTTDALLTSLHGLRPLWSQIGFRARSDGAVTRNPLGFRDGIVQPEVVDGVPEHVWLTDGPWAGATVGVVRRFVLDVAGFRALDTAEQERVFGRRKESGEPLSGGAPDASPGLGAKSPEGAYLIPVDAHVRAAHPSFTDSTVMLRRSYGFRDAVDGAADRVGLLFLCYQDDVAVFSRTQTRMDRIDRLMDFATPTAESAFLVLPGFDRQRPLGSTLF